MQTRIGHIIATPLLTSENRIKDRLNLSNRHFNIPQARPGLTQIHELVEPVHIIRPERSPGS